MADSSERNNPPQIEEEEEEDTQQQQMEITNNQPHTEPDDDDEDEDFDNSDEEDEQEEEEEEEEDSYSEEEEEEDDDDEEEYLDPAPAVMSPRVPMNSVGAVGEVNGCGEGGKVAAAAVEGGEVDGLICPICMSPWTNGGDHQLCCLSCGHLYGLSCIRRWLERKGSAKCPQCNQKCKPKDVRVIYASRVVVADEESKEKIQGLEAKMALLEKMIKRFGFHEGHEVTRQGLAAIHQKLDVIHQEQRTFQQEQLKFQQEHRTFQQEHRTFQQEQLKFQQEQRTFWQERERIDKQRYKEHCTFQQEQRTFRHELSQYMQQQTGNSSQPWTPPLPLGPTQ